jgi:hypothetical protein
MSNLVQQQPKIPTDSHEINRRATVRYRCAPKVPGRAFIANSCKSVSALVVDVSLGGIGLILECHIEEGTLLRIEMGKDDKEVLVDRAANIAHNTPIGDGRWRCGCEWVYPLTEEELQVLR